MFQLTPFIEPGLLEHKLRIALVWPVKFSFSVSDHRPVPGALSCLLHMRNRHRQPLPASLPGTLPDPAMQGASAQHMTVSMGGSVCHAQDYKHTHMYALWFIDGGTVT